MKKITKFIKKVLFNLFFLYTFNVIAEPANIIIPINFFTIILMTIFGIQTLFVLIFIKFLIF